MIRLIAAFASSLSLFSALLRHLELGHYHSLQLSKGKEKRSNWYLELCLLKQFTDCLFHFQQKVRNKKMIIYIYIYEK